MRSLFDCGSAVPRCAGVGGGYAFPPLQRHFFIGGTFLLLPRFSKDGRSLFDGGSAVPLFGGLGGG